MSEYLERDEKYEPAVLPSAGELLHWGDLYSSPAAPPPPLADDDPSGFTRFVPRRSKGRVVAATVVTVALAGMGAWGIGGFTMGEGVTGIGAFFGSSTIIATVGGLVWGTWRWARRRRGGAPRIR